MMSFGCRAMLLLLCLCRGPKQNWKHGVGLPDWVWLPAPLPWQEECGCESGNSCCNCKGFPYCPAASESKPEEVGLNCVLLSAELLKETCLSPKREGTRLGGPSSHTKGQNSAQVPTLKAEVGGVTHVPGHPRTPQEKNKQTKAQSLFKN